MVPNKWIVKGVLVGHEELKKLFGSNIGVPYLYMCFGLVEQPQRGVPTAVWSQRDERLQLLQTKAQMCSSERRRPRQ